MSTIVASPSSFLFFFHLSFSLSSRNVAHARYTFSRVLLPSSTLHSSSFLSFSYIHVLSLCFFIFHTFVNSHTYDRAHTFELACIISALTPKFLSFSFLFFLFLFVVDVAPFFRFEHFFGEVGVRLCHFLSFR